MFVSYIFTVYSITEVVDFDRETMTVFISDDFCANEFKTPALF